MHSTRTDYALVQEAALSRLKMKKFLAKFA
jgi:hypothetical protein